MLLALLVYAYAVGQRSSRRIEGLCVDHVAFRVLCAQDGPDHSTIARFRAEHHDAFVDLFAQVLRLVGGGDGQGRCRVDRWHQDRCERLEVSEPGPWVGSCSGRPDRRRGDRRRRRDRCRRRRSGRRQRPDQDGLPPGLATGKGRAVNIRKALAELDRQQAERARCDSAEQARAHRSSTAPGPSPCVARSRPGWIRWPITRPGSAGTSG